jgi:hypothetical protein
LVVQKVYPVTVGLASDLAKQPSFLARLDHANMPFKYQADRDYYLEALYRAGLDSGVRDCSQKRSSWNLRVKNNLKLRQKRASAVVPNKK